MSHTTAAPISIGAAVVMGRKRVACLKILEQGNAFEEQLGHGHELAFVHHQDAIFASVVRTRRDHDREFPLLEMKFVEFPHALFGEAVGATVRIILTVDQAMVHLEKGIDRQPTLERRPTGGNRAGRSIHDTSLGFGPGDRLGQGFGKKRGAVAGKAAVVFRRRAKGVHGGLQVLDAGQRVIGIVQGIGFKTAVLPAVDHAQGEVAPLHRPGHQQVQHDANVQLPFIGSITKGVVRIGKQLMQATLNVFLGFGVAHCCFPVGTVRYDR